jgi:hypothetical protein
VGTALGTFAVGADGATGIEVEDHGKMARVRNQGAAAPVR